MKRFLALCLLASFTLTALPLSIPAIEGENTDSETLLRKFASAEAESAAADFAQDLFLEERSIVSVSLSSTPKQSYWIGEALDVSDGFLTLVFNDGTRETIPLTGDMVSGFSSEESGSLSLTVSYGGFECSYDVEVFENSVLSIELVSDFTKQVYLEGDSFDVSGGRILVRYENGTMEEIDVASSMIFGFRPHVTGNQQISVLFGGAETSFTVRVEAKSVESISISSLPVKRVYGIGESLNVSGGELLVAYNNNTNQIIPIQPLMISGFDTTSQGELSLTVNYEGKTASFSVSVVSVLRGDLNFDGSVNSMDATYLLYHLFLPSEYPVNQRVDYNLDGLVTDRDVLALLRGEIRDEEDDGGDDGDGSDDGGGGGLIDGPGIGTEVPPVGDFPFSAVGASGRASSKLRAELSATEIYNGKTAELLLTCDPSVRFTSAFLTVECDSSVAIVGADWIDKGVLSDVSESLSRAVLLKESKTPSENLFSLTLHGLSVTEGAAIRISVVFCDEQGNKVATETAEVILKIAEVPFQYGDINGDACIDDADYLLLLRHLNGWEQEIPRPNAMDVNTDGIVNSLDGLLLLRYVSGMQVQFGK